MEEGILDKVGLRWYKCDFHLHTMASKCYVDKQIDTLQEWINTAKQKGLECIAVTDHNDYRSIDEVMKIGKENNLIVFPGVELSCDSSKIHILVLFDIDCDGNTVQEFLSQLKIFRADLGDSSHTADGDIFHACEIAKSMNALVIPAHVDEYSGLSDISYDNISKLLDRKYIDGVQVVNDEIWENYGNEPLHIISEKLTEKYGKTITDEQAKAWISVYQQVKNSGFPLLSFSDNPYSEKSSKHGMWGIGASYTYLKMSQTPNLESVRQALISNDMRVEKNAESNHMIGESPDMIIREVVLSNSILNENAKIDVSFNSQLNTIIGGRGSGKSSIIRTIAGGMNSFSGENLNIISQEQMEFYKENGKTKSSNIKKGIFTKNSVVEILVERLGDLYKIEVSHIKNMQNQTRKLYKYINDNWQLVEDENFIDLFKAQIFTQKQIYELATDSNSLMAIIDGDISGMSNCVSEREAALNNLIGKALEISNCRRSIAKKSKLETELADIEDQISKFKQSGISDIIKEKQLYDDQQKVISSYVENKNNKIEEIETFIKQVNLTYDLIDDSEINEILDDDLKDFNSDIESIYKILHDIVKKSDKIVEKINATNWNHRKIENGENYLQAVKNLQDNGLDTRRLDELIDKRKDKKQELEIIRNKEQELESLEQEYNEKEKIYKEKNVDIYNLRSQFIQEVIGNDKSVKFDLKKNRNRSSFINNIRSIIQKDIVSVEDDINKLADIFFKDKNGIKNYKELLVNIRTKQDQTSLSKYTRDAVCGLPEDSYARLLAYIPDDDLVVSYKPEKAKKFIHLSNASAGQKTTTILTFLLAYGKQPLLLDQPEDDLDNRLVYDLIVARLKVAKSKRQIIVVTHNANIPVNGDSEYIISMNSDTDIIQVNKTGTMDDTEIRQEICDVMEGTKDAFEMRAKKYHFNISE